MNFEQLGIKRISIKSDIRTLLLKYEEAQIAKKNSLKLGAVTFDIVTTTIFDFVINQSVEMRYIRQDTTDDDSLKLETRLAALKWQWNARNVIALLFVLFLMLLFLISAIKVWYYNNLPDLAYKDPKYDDLLDYSLRTAFQPTKLPSLNFIENSNYFIVDFTISACQFFNVFF